MSTRASRHEGGPDAQSNHTLDGQEQVPASAGAPLEPPTTPTVSPLQALLQKVGWCTSSGTQAASRAASASSPHRDASGADGAGGALHDTAVDPIVPAGALLEPTDPAGPFRPDHPDTMPAAAEQLSGTVRSVEPAGHGRQTDAPPSTDAVLVQPVSAEPGELRDHPQPDEARALMDRQMQMFTSMVSQQLRQQQQEFAAVLSAVLSERQTELGSSFTSYEPFSNGCEPHVGTEAVPVPIEPIIGAPKITHGTSTMGTRDTNDALGEAFNSVGKPDTSQSSSRPSGSFTSHDTTSGGREDGHDRQAYQENAPRGVREDESPPSRAPSMINVDTVSESTRINVGAQADQNVTIKLLEAQTALINRIGKEKVRQGNTLWKLPWVTGSTHPALRGFTTAVNEQMAAATAPSDKSSLHTVYETLKPEVLLKPFHDGLPQAQYLEERMRLTTSLYSLACTATSEGKADGLAFAVVVRALGRSASGSKPLGGGANSYTRLEQISTRVNELSQGETIKNESGLLSGANTANLLNLFDCAFAAPTRFSNYRQLEEALNELSFERGVPPSAALVRMRQLINMHEGADSRGVWEKTSSHISTQLSKQLNNHEVLRPFVDKIMDADFAERSFDDWHKQFLIYEDDIRFKDALASVKSRVGGQVSTRPQTMPKTRHNEQSGQTQLLNRIAALERARDSSEPPQGRDWLSGQVASASASIATGTSRGTGSFGFDEAWVLKEGVPGKPAPSSREKWPLWTAKVCEALNVSMPEGMPRGDVMVGSKCPVCAERGVIPSDNWYYHPNNPAFVENGSRERPQNKPRCSWMHHHSKCSYLWAKVHKHVKLNPNDAYLFDKLPEGQDPAKP